MRIFQKSVPAVFVALFLLVQTVPAFAFLDGYDYYEGRYDSSWNIDYSSSTWAPTFYTDTKVDGTGNYGDYGTGTGTGTSGVGTTPAPVGEYGVPGLSLPEGTIGVEVWPSGAIYCMESDVKVYTAEANFDTKKIYDYLNTTTELRVDSEEIGEVTVYDDYLPFNYGYIYPHKMFGGTITVHSTCFQDGFVNQEVVVDDPDNVSGKIVPGKKTAIYIDDENKVRDAKTGELYDRAKYNSAENKIYYGDTATVFGVMFDARTGYINYSDPSTPSEDYPYPDIADLDGSVAKSPESAGLDTDALVSVWNEKISLGDQSINFSYDRFSDVDVESDYYEILGFLAERNILGGYPDGTFKPDRLMSRVEVLRVLLDAAGVEVPDVSASETAGFSDVVPGQWYVKYVKAAKDKGIVSGYPDGTFGVTKTIKLGEALKMLFLANDIEVPDLPEDAILPSDVKENHWFAPYVYYANINLKILEADANGNVHPGEDLSRAHFSQFVFRLVFIEENLLDEFASHAWAIYEAKREYGREKNLGTNFSAGPCLSNKIIPDTVADVAHNPRAEVDDDPVNQCPAFAEGRASHFVELDEGGNAIFVY
ncbi:MAG: S-layer homology domain-containing protein [Patescibacteria group bacterium]